MRVLCTVYEDEVLVSVDVGYPSGGPRTGISVAAELGFDSGSESARRQDRWTRISFFDWSTSAQAQEEAWDAPLFRVMGVHVDVPGLAITLARSRHWLRNALLLQPLAAPVVRRAVGWVLESQICALFERAAAFGGRVRKRARDSATQMEGPRDGKGRRSALELGLGVDDWWNAVAGEIARGSSWKPDNEDGGGEDRGSREDDLVEDELATRATMQGIVPTTSVTLASLDAEPEESVLTVGIGVHVFPAKGCSHGATSASRFAVEEWACVRGRKCRRRRRDVAAIEEGGVQEGVTNAVEVSEVVQEVRLGRGWRGGADGEYLTSDV